MLFIGDEKRHRGFPWMTLLLIVANVTVYQAQVYFGDRLTFGCSLVAKEITTGQDIVGRTPITVYEPVDELSGHTSYTKHVIIIEQQPGPTPIYLTLVTSIFLHGNGFHLIGNMLYLLVFGRNVERAMGSGLFLVFYLVVGVAAGMTHVFVNPDGLAPYLGASGAISGIMGAYFFLFPFNWVKVWLIFAVVQVPTIFVLGGWVLLQFLDSMDAVQSGQVQVGIAYWAHVGGFAAGFLFVATLLAMLKMLSATTGPEPAPDVWEAAKQGPRNRYRR
jgi:membrane associated rhomboid family serine protease